MSTTRGPDELYPTPYTPAGDVESILTDLEAVPLDAAGTTTDQGDDVLPALDDALAELATETSEPAGEPLDDADGTDWALQSGQAEFQAVAASTDVESVPFDDAATFLASELYAVPPANTRFDWVDADALV